MLAAIASNDDAEILEVMQVMMEADVEMEDAFCERTELNYFNRVAKAAVNG